jgi:hypothetical protein
MKNHILNSGKILTKTQQKQINGGGDDECMGGRGYIDECGDCILKGAAYLPSC